MHRRRLPVSPAISAMPALAQQAFPTRAVAVASGHAPGGVTDIVSRAVSARMDLEPGRPAVVENRVGAATAVAGTHASQARPDGCTLLMGTGAPAINPALRPDLTPREPMREPEPVGMVFRTAFVPQVHPDRVQRRAGGAADGARRCHARHRHLLGHAQRAAARHAPVGDAVPGFETMSRHGLFAPAGPPAPIIARPAEQGVDVVSGDAPVLRDTLAREAVMWGDLIRTANIRAE